jgi:hypothetical protein
MAKVELIGLDKIPTSSSWKASATLLVDLTEKLREALHKNQALIVRLADDERPPRFAKLLRAAADHLGILVIITSAEPRQRKNGSDRLVVEASVLYARITKAAAKPAQPASGPRTVDTMLRPPITTPHAGYEPTLLPGVEVSR